MSNTTKREKESIKFNGATYDCQAVGQSIWQHMEKVVQAKAKEISEANPDYYNYQVRDDVVRAIDFSARTMDGNKLPLHSAIKLESTALLDKMRAWTLGIGAPTLEELNAQLRELHNRAKDAVKELKEKEPAMLKAIAAEIKKQQKPESLDIAALLN